MLFDKGKPRSSGGGRRGAYQPGVHPLEDRLLLATNLTPNSPIDLGATVPPTTLPLIASNTISPNPGMGVAASPFYGVDMAGAQSSGGAGWTVTDVGDMNGDGFDDFVIGAPTVTNTNGTINIASGGNSRAYLVFGSLGVNLGNIDWLTLQAQQRVGNLSQLDNLAGGQFNPVNGAQGFPFAGITFFESQNNRAQLGASVAPVPGGINGAPAFLIGAPGANALGDVNNASPNTGRAFLIYGGSYLNNLTPQAVIDLDNLATTPVVDFVTFGTTNATLAGTARIGQSVAALGNFFNDTGNAIAIGAPNASYNGNARAGQVYILSGFAVPKPGNFTPVDVSLVGQTTLTGAINGLVFGGPTAGAMAGFSIANAGNVDGTLSGFNTGVSDALIGAPGASTAYLIYGGTNLIGAATIVAGINSINLSLIGDPTVTPGSILGAVFTGGSGDLTGYSVSTAGDVNNDGFSDFLIGSPLANGGTGQATLIYGNGPRSTTPIRGVISLTTTLPSTIFGAYFVGDNVGDLVGYSVGQSGKIRASLGNPFLIGSPGYNASQGAVYLVPSDDNNGAGYTNTSFRYGGTYNLDPNGPGTATANASPVAVLLTMSQTAGVTSPTYFGASVGGTPILAGQTKTADGDLVGDFIVGAPGYGADTTTTGALGGGGLIVEGATISNLFPFISNVTSTVAINAGTTPGVINAQNKTLTITISPNVNVSLNGGLTTFNPATDLNPTTFVLNGVPVTGVLTTTGTTTTASTFTFTLTTNQLNLFNGAQTFTISALTSANVLPFRYVAATGVTVTGGNGPTPTPTPTGSTASALPIGTIIATTFVPQYGNDRFVPAPSTLSTFDYKPIPFKVAYRQFQPTPGFTMRTLNYFFPNKFHFQAARTHASGGAYTLGQHTFDTSKYHPGKTIEFTHKVPVIPTNLQHEKVAPRTPLGGKLP